MWLSTTALVQLKRIKFTLIFLDKIRLFVNLFYCMETVCGCGNFWRTTQCGYSWSLFVTLHIWVNVLMSLLSNYFKEISHQIGKWLSPKRTYREKGGQIWSVFGLFLRQLCFKQDEGRRKLETYLTVLTADACCGNQFGQTIAIKIGWWWRIFWGDSANCEMVFFLRQKGMNKYFLVISSWLVFQIPIWWWIFTSRN